MVEAPDGEKLVPKHDDAAQKQKRAEAYWRRYQGMTWPHYTVVPDMLFDEMLPLLGHAELRVLMVIVRKTFGWRDENGKPKMFDKISLSQLTDGSGLTRRSVQRAVKGLEDKGIIWIRRDETKLGDAEINTYGLVLASESQVGRDIESPPQGHNDAHKKHSYNKQETKDGSSSSSDNLSSEKTTLITALHAELSPRSRLQSRLTFLGQFSIEQIQEAAEVTRADIAADIVDNPGSPMAYLYGVVRNISQRGEEAKKAKRPGDLQWARNLINDAWQRGGTAEQRLSRYCGPEEIEWLRQQGYLDGEGGGEG